MGKNKEKKILKQKSGDDLEPAPAYVFICKDLQKDQLQANKDEESPMTSISASLESSSEKPKKKQKRKYLSEQQAENNCSKDQHSEGHHENRKRKKKKSKNEAVNHIEDTNNEDVECFVITEEPPRKKRKREKTKEVNEAKELETQSDEKSEEAITRKKKKKLKESNENLSEKRKEPEEVNLTVESETQSSEKPAKKKKLKKSKENLSEKRKETEEVDLTVESETRSSEEPTKKKKLKESKKNLLEKRKEREEVDLTMESETRSNKEPKKKKKKHKSKDKDHNHSAEQSENVRTVFTTQETQTFPNLVLQDDKEDMEIQMNTCEVKDSTRLDESLLKQLKEFIPNIESRNPLNVSKMIKYDLPRFKEFKKRGIALNHGRFTAKENKMLRKNVQDFMALTAIDNASKLFFTYRYKEERHYIKQLKVTYRFFERIAQGIPRSCCYVYGRGRKMFDEQNYQGQFSKEELHTLNKLHTLHGNNWKKISELTGRSALALQKRFAQIASNDGPWSRKEVQRLLRAVRDHIVSQIPGGANNIGSMRVMKETLYKRLPLLQIAKEVKTRSWIQCREKWMSILAVKMSCGSVGTEKTSLDIQVKLIKGMYEMDVDDAAHIDWDYLTALIGNIPPTYLQRKWHRLKVGHVPEWHTKCFADITDFLYEKVLPHLQEKLLAYKDLDESQIRENEESYLLSDIFQDINEDEDEEDINEDDEDDNLNKPVTESVV